MIKRTSKILISLAFASWQEARARSARLLRREPPARAIVITYHDVSAEEMSGFEAQMRLLKRFAIPVRASLLDPLSAGRIHVAVTFDDGYQNLLSNALPVLSRERVPCTIFMPSGSLGGRPQWSMDRGCRHAEQQIMTAQQIRDIDGDLVDIGSHTHSHPRLSELKDEEIRAELLTSKEQLEEILDKKVSLLAFPHGDWDERVLALAREVGYERVFSVLPSFARVSGESFLVGRVSVSPDDSPLEFWLKITGAYRWQLAASTAKHSWKRLFLRRRPQSA